MVGKLQLPSLCVVVVLIVLLSALARVPDEVFDNFASEGFSPPDLFGGKAWDVSNHSDRHLSAIKLDWVRKRPAPDYAAIGLHFIENFREVDFQVGFGSKVSFFNYDFQHLSLVEVPGLLKYLKQIDRLPRKALILSIPAPNWGRQFIFNYQGTFPNWGILNTPPTEGRACDLEQIRDCLARRWEIIQVGWDRLNKKWDWLNQYNQLVSGLRYIKFGTVGEDCDGKLLCGHFVTNILLSIKNAADSIVRVLKAKNKLPAPHMFVDGSFDRHRKIDLKLAKLPPYGPNDARLRWLKGDTQRFLVLLDEIQSLTKSYGLKTIILIPPPYFPIELSLVTIAYEEVIKARPHWTWIDDLKYSYNPKLFLDTVHPNHLYFQDLSRRVRVILEENT